MSDIRLIPLDEGNRPAYEMLYEASFPASERKSLDYMLTGDRSAFYEVLVVSTTDHPVAGMVITVTDGSLTMLDYLAVSPDLRGQGLGHAILPLVHRRVKETVGGSFFLEIETPPPACIPRDPCENAEQRVRRKAFYRSVGLVETGVRAFIYGNDMELLSFPEDAEQITFEGYDTLLKTTFPATMVAEKL